MAAVDEAMDRDVPASSYVIAGMVMADAAITTWQELAIRVHVQWELARPPHCSVPKSC